MIIEKRKYGIFDLIKTPLTCAPGAAILAGLQIILAGIVPTVQVVVTARFLDTAVFIGENRAPLNLIYPALFAVVILIAYQWISGELAKFAQIRMELALREKFRTALTERRAQLLYKYIEETETWDLISRVTNNPEGRLKTAYIDLLHMASIMIRVAGLLLLLLMQVWWAAVVIFAVSLPLFVLAVRSGRATYETSREVIKYERKYQYLSEVLTGREAVEERALFGYGEEVNKLWLDQYETARKISLRAERKWFIKMKSGSLLTALVSVIVVLVLINPVLSGAITTGMFIALINAAFALVHMMSWSLTHYIDELAKHLEYLKDLSQFAALEETAGATAVPSFPPPAFASLEFKEVRFKYPGTANYVLNGLSFRIEAGRHYAFVGLNGAGKTTIIKLITGLYNEFEGEILINGKSIAGYEPSRLKALFSVVHQDYARYYITLIDNIKLGYTNAPDDEETARRIQEVLARMGLSASAARLPQGIDTPLGKIKAGGQDLSGGEWQRLAMARALLKPASLLILDEPTAALDPLSESRLYEEFEAISRGRTTIFISHRLGSTKLADEIFVIHNGQVVEKGSHAQLLAANGIYAAMYESQRSWYQ